MPKTILTVLIFSLFIFSGIAECKNEVKLILVKGEPKIMKRGTDTWNTCKVNIPVENGDRIKTSKNEAVEISFSDNSAKVVKIEENSDVFIKKCDAPYSIELLNGSAMALLQNLPKGSTFEIRTPAGLSGARGTGWSVTVNELKAIFKAFENFIYVKGIDASGNEIEGELVVRSGWQTIVDMFAKPGALEELAAGDFDKWNEWKKDLLKRLEELRQKGFREAGQIENKIQELEDRKLDVRESRDSNRILERQEGGDSSGGGSKGGGNDSPQ